MTRLENNEVQLLTKNLCPRGCLVYKIPYRHARAWPGGQVPKARLSKGCMQGTFARARTRPKDLRYMCLKNNFIEFFFLNRRIKMQQIKENKTEDHLKGAYTIFDRRGRVDIVHSRAGQT